MKRNLIPLILVLIYLVFGVCQGTAQSRRFQLVFGPRVGAIYMTIDPEEFNERLQVDFPSEAKYYPLMTQFGLNLEQRIRLGNTESHFAFQEVLLIGGLGQNLFIPILATMIGFRSKAGLEIGMGPNFSLSREHGITVSVCHALGWTFNFSNVHVPVNIVADFTSRDGDMRFGILTRFNFTLF